MTENKEALNFDIQKFNPTVAELTSLSNQYKGLKIAGIEDKDWYEKVKKAQLDLRDKRVHIEKTLKEVRQKAIDFQKAVIQQEKDLVAIIDGTEKELKAERSRIDELIKIEERKKVLPARKEELERCWILASDEQILAMNSDQFNQFVKDEVFKQLQEKQKKEEEERLAKERAEAEKRDKKNWSRQGKKLKLERLQKLKRDWRESLRKKKQELKLKPKLRQKEKLKKRKNFSNRKLTKLGLKRMVMIQASISFKLNEIKKLCIWESQNFYSLISCKWPKS